MKKKLYNLVLTLSIFLLAFCFTVCEINLGEYIDFHGPVVKITDPIKQLDQERLLVPTVFNLTGTAECQNEITFMEISLERYDPYLNWIEPLPMQWKYENGIWNFRESSSKTWRIYQESDYKDAIDPDPNSKEIKAPSWEVNEYLVNWNIPISLADVMTGDVFITVNALDKPGNRNAESTAVLKVYYNNNEPMFGIRSPAAPFIRANTDGFLLQVYDPANRPIETRNNIGNWITDAQWKIDYIIDAEAGYPFDLLLEFTDDYVVYEDRVVYYTQTIQNISVKFGSINISNINAGVDSDKPTYMKIVTTLTDINDKEYKPKFNGYIAYLKDAEKPWTTIGFDYLLKNGRGSGTAYGKNFLKTTGGITWVVTEMDQFGATQKLYSGGVGTGEIPSNSDIYGWTLTVGNDWNTGDYYKIDVTVTDINGNFSVNSKNFKVESNSTPRVQEDSILPVKGEPLFGDTTGNFVLSATADISGPRPGTIISKAAIAWVRPDSPNAANARLIYSDRTYQGWNNANANGYLDTTNRVVLWEIPTGNIVYDKTNSVTGLDEYKLSKNFNVFNDLNVGLGSGKFPVSAMDFIIRVASNADSAQNPRSSTQTFTTGADITNPTVNLTHINITRSGNSTALTWPLQESMLSALKQGDSIWFQGTWTDNSRERWAGLSETALKALFTRAAVVWEGESNFNFIVNDGDFLTNPNSSGGGAWRTQPRVFNSDNTDAFIYLDVTIGDLSGNRGVFRESIMIETDNPTLTMITSGTSDGTYGEESEFDSLLHGGYRPILIDLVFNKPVQFNNGNPPGTTDSPYLRLNNLTNPSDPNSGGRAYYHDGNGTSTLTFVYFVDGRVGPSYIYADSSVSNALNAGGSTPQGSKLNVTGINPRGFPLATWVSTEGNTVVSIPSDVFNPSSTKSLASMKNIVIDKTAPIISRFTSTTTDIDKNGNPYIHGRNSKININVEFSEPISVTPNNISSSDIKLTLSGIAGTPTPYEALFTSVTGPTSLGFTYTVPTNASTHYSTADLSINQFIAAAGVVIRDQAGNKLAGGTITPADKNIYSSHPIQAKLRVETRPPNPVNITIPSAGNPTSPGALYSNADIRINNILQPISSTIEYTLNRNDPSPVWTTLTGSVMGILGSGYATVPLEINGTYSIAVRQYDTANPRNVSADSNVLSVTMDKGNILERITSTYADGIYGAILNPALTIDLVFRKGLTLTGTASNVTLTLSNGNTAVMTGSTGIADSNGGFRTWRFTAANPLASTNGPLNVNSINFLATSTSFLKDLSGTNVNTWIRLDAGAGVLALPAANNLNKQKSIEILTGNPAVQGIVFNQTPKTLVFTFNRNVYSANNPAKAVIMQQVTGFRIPSVLTVQEYNNLFVGRSDLNSIAVIASLQPASGGRPSGYTSNADWWRWIGNQLYEQDTNGANSAYVSDTATKYVLRFNYSTLPAAPTVTGMPSAANLVTMFREAEALRFDANDKEVTFKDDTVTFDLTRLPVLGAEYQITLPNGFVQDFLGNLNGGTTTGNETLGTGTLTPNGVEPPFIRIDKGSDIETLSGTTDSRQAIQPLTARARIDCRTPGATLQSASQKTTDNVGRLIWRANPSNAGNRLPNLGNHTVNDWASFNSVKNRPQSGGINPATGANWTGTGYNIWSAMGTLPALSEYTADNIFSIGNDNFNDGGMIIHIHARSINGTYQEDAYEAAYRSVFVFHNSSIHDNLVNYDSNMNEVWKRINNVGYDFTNPARARMWIRGGDATQGSSSIPGFPLSRDKTESRKARLLTPVNGDVFGGSLANAQTASFTNGNSNIPTTGYNTNGQYVWFWVTWKINVNAYIDMFAAELPSSASDAYQVPTDKQKDIYQGYAMAKEHFPVIPGRTTICEIRPASGYDNYVDGGHGHLAFGPISNIPARRD